MHWIPRLGARQARGDRWAWLAAARAKNGASPPQSEMLVCLCLPFPRPFGLSATTVLYQLPSKRLKEGNAGAIVHIGSINGPWFKDLCVMRDFFGFL
jgi:hypothetical protein